MALDIAGEVRKFLSNLNDHLPPKLFFGVSNTMMAIYNNYIDILLLTYT